MKKFTALCFTVIIMATSTTAFADASIDFSSYSIEELFTIRKELDTAIFEKDGKVIAELGDYVVGTDIAAGKYIIKPYYANDTDKEAGESAGVSYTIENYVGASKDYYALENEYNAAYQTAITADKAGEAVTWPTKPTFLDYYVIKDKLIEAPDQSERIELQEGQVLSFNSWGYPVIITLEKASGLFME